MKRLQILVKGRVQGVGYRAFVQDKATSLKLYGYVKNMPDGSVFIDVQGDEEKLNLLIDYLKKGPPMSRVDSLDIKPMDILADYTRFSISY
ncbi:MAG: acylphosphatase [Calditerrivibrio sp.]|nr:acylphosphatase [Calditerrivibrio sp.]